MKYEHYAFVDCHLQKKKPIKTTKNNTRGHFPNFVTHNF